MRLGIIGYDGFVGSALFKTFSEDKKYSVIGINRGNYSEFLGSEFDVLINADGNSSKLLADRDPVADFEMNALATLKALHDFKSDHYVHISTVAVYPKTDRAEATDEGAEIDALSLSNYGFSKYAAELIVKRHAKSWMILRLAGMVGENMKKGPVYDIIKLGKLFVSAESRYQFLNTIDVARITQHLIEKNRYGQVYNVVGKGSIALSEIARIAKVELMAYGKELHRFNVSTKKIEKEVKLPSSIETVKDFVTLYNERFKPVGPRNHRLSRRLMN